MSEVTKFIPMEENSGSVGGNISTGIENAGATGNAGVENGSSAFKVCGSSTNLPAKPSLWARIKGVLFHEIKVELTPQQQKVEDEINEFLHKEITWKSVKDFLFQEIKLW